MNDTWIGIICDKWIGVGFSSHTELELYTEYDEHHGSGLTCRRFICNLCQKTFKGFSLADCIDNVSSIVQKCKQNNKLCKHI